MNAQGKRNLIILLLLLLPGLLFSYANHTRFPSAEAFYGVSIAVIIFPPLIFYSFLVRKVDGKIDAAVASQLGYSFDPHLEATPYLKDLKIQNKNEIYDSITEVYSGKLGDVDFKVFNYVRKVGSNRDAAYYPFTGIVYQVQKNFPQLHLLAHWWAERIQLFGSVNTESDEFNQKFRVFCDDKEAMLYVLSPDVMAKLIDSQSQLEHSIETADNRIVIYTAKIAVTHIKFKDVLSGTFTDDSVAAHKELVANFILKTHEVFKIIYR